MRLPVIPTLLAAALAAGGCSSPTKSIAQQERALRQQNSREAESRRMRALDYGDVASKRGAEILVVDPTKTFDPNRSGIGTARTVATGGATTKDFSFDQKVHPGNFLTRAFAHSKPDAAAQKKYATKEAGTDKYALPDAARETRKTAGTKGLWDGTKVAATRDLPDGNRPFLGPESLKVRKAIDPKSLADWRSGGGESVSYTSGTVERMGTLKQLTIEDVRELLNKNK